MMIRSIYHYYYYCVVCLLIGGCWCRRIGISDFIQSEDYTNDSPFNVPKIEVSRHKTGADILIKCNADHHQHLNKDNIVWEFHPCASNYRGVQCHNMHKIIDGSGGGVDDTLHWHELDHSRGRNRLEIRNSSEAHNGLYRCIYNESIKKIYMIEIVDLVKYNGPAPQVLSLIPSTNSSTVQPHTNLVIQCKITSVIPPKILWFRRCGGLRCDVKEIDYCFCHINTTYSMYATGNVYFSKIGVYDARRTDAGLYACLAVSVFGKDYKNVSIEVAGGTGDTEETANENNKMLMDGHHHYYKSLSWLFLIPLAMILIPIVGWLCCYRVRTKTKKSVVMVRMDGVISDSNNAAEGGINTEGKKLIKSSVVMMHHQ